MKVRLEKLTLGEKRIDFLRHEDWQKKDRPTKKEPMSPSTSKILNLFEVIELVLLKFPDK